MYSLPILEEGQHEVLIDKIYIGNLYEIPFLKIYFVNKFGYIPHKIILTDKTKIILKILFNVIGLVEDSDFHKIVGRKLKILVVGDYYKAKNDKMKYSLDVKKFIPLMKQ